MEVLAGRHDAPATASATKPATAGARPAPISRASRGPPPGTRNEWSPPSITTSRRGRRARDRLGQESGCAKGSRDPWRKSIGRPPAEMVAAQLSDAPAGGGDSRERQARRRASPRPRPSTRSGLQRLPPATSGSRSARRPRPVRAATSRRAPVPDRRLAAGVHVREVEPRDRQAQPGERMGDARHEGRRPAGAGPMAEDDDRRGAGGRVEDAGRRPRGVSRVNDALILRTLQLQFGSKP